MIIVPFIAAVLALPQFEVQTLDGRVVQGPLVQLSAEQITVETPEGKREFPTKDLLSAVAKGLPNTQLPHTAILVLADGSRITAIDFEAENGTAKIKLSAEASVELPVKAIRSVRFVDANEDASALDSQWTELGNSSPSGDLLVIRKKGTIDSTDGIVGDITHETISFTLDGDKIDVKRPKIEGIVFAQTGVAEFPEGICTVSSASGSRYMASDIELNGDQLQITTPAGFKTLLAMDSVSHLDYSSGKIAYLSDLEAETFSYEPFFAPAKTVSVLGKFYNLRRDSGLENKPLKLDGQTYRKGLALHSRSVVSYRLPGKFRLFKAIVGIDDAARDRGGDVALEIKGDGKSLWKMNVRSSEAAHALELDISGIKRLEIVADFGERQDIADHLDLCDAKVTK
jgi:hypothetical protein